MKINVWNRGGPNTKRLTVDLAGKFIVAVAILIYIKIAVTLRGLRCWNKQSDFVRERDTKRGDPVTSSSTSL